MTRSSRSVRGALSLLLLAGLVCALPGCSVLADEFGWLDRSGIAAPKLDGVSGLDRP